MSLIVLGVVLLLIGLVAYLLGANGVAGVSVEIGKIVLFVAIALVVLAALIGLLDGGSSNLYLFD